MFIKQPETDVVLGFFDEDGNGIIKDYYASNYIPPKEDESQDLLDTEIKRLDGVTTIKFKRKFDTSDSKVNKKMSLYIITEKEKNPKIVTSQN